MASISRLPALHLQQAPSRRSVMCAMTLKKDESLVGPLAAFGEIITLAI